MAGILTAGVLLLVYSPQQSVYAMALMDGSVRKLAAPIAISGSNIFTAWPNNDLVIGASSLQRVLMAAKHSVKQ